MSDTDDWPRGTRILRTQAEIDLWIAVYSNFADESVENRQACDAADNAVRLLRQRMPRGADA